MKDCNLKSKLVKNIWDILKDMVNALTPIILNYIFCIAFAYEVYLDIIQTFLISQKLAMLPWCKLAIKQETLLRMHEHSPVELLSQPWETTSQLLHHVPLLIAHTSHRFFFWFFFLIKHQITQIINVPKFSYKPQKKKC